MKYKVLLSRFEDTREFESQEQSRFINSIFEALELPINFDPDAPLTVEIRQEIRQKLKEFNIDIIDDMDKGIKIYIGDDIIAEWYKTIFKLKQDISQKDPQDRLYIEANINFWSVFEDKEEDDEV